MDKKDSGDDHARYPLADTETGKKVSRTVVDKTGYDPVDLLNAPTKPPQLQNTRRSFSVLQFTLIVAGAVIAVVGLVVWVLLLQSGIGFMVMAVGAACVAIGVLIRV